MASKRKDDSKLFSALTDRIEGELYTDTLHRYLLSTDASIFRVMPAALVYPKTTAEVQAAVIFTAQHGLPLHARGAGSGLCGAAIG